MRAISFTQNADPGIARGVRDRQDIWVAAITAATLLLAACTPRGEQPDAAPGTTSIPTTTFTPEATSSTVTPTPEATTSTTITTSTIPTASPTEKVASKSEKLRAKAQAAAENFAARILEELDKDQGAEKVLYQPAEEPHRNTVEIVYETETLLDGASGEYRLLANMDRRDAEGNVMPVDVNAIAVSESVHVAGTETAKRVIMYNFQLIRNPKTGNWSMNVGYQHEDGDPLGIFTETGQTGDRGQSQPITPEQLDAYFDQAATVIDWAVERRPVDIVPPVE